ncbi:hypothetical protein L226DRAFT_520099 [Lentinus tigrinus ALCF2SS1-7]|uniref:RING-type domain-containing protein n=1 Tax=Lentinus tigrinus ALCF2SS1-6 TaxID=1328759 RepID=A0A5C2SPY8_9APHY|nr:hypothetical protein L227DRAFT_560288 [Lentinus tigrinus ALCF2SS1-6]RPD79028.1 hypothetical protein L226DRAFT_520099 [Lentinus tigrinus ALCF2SS1-7]
MSLNLQCPICYGSFSHLRAMATPCGHIFCHGCIGAHLKYSVRCPVCRYQPVRARKLVHLFLHSCLPQESIMDLPHAVEEFKADVPTDVPAPLRMPISVPMIPPPPTPPIMMSLPRHRAAAIPLSLRDDSPLLPRGVPVLPHRVGSSASPSSGSSVGPGSSGTRSVRSAGLSGAHSPVGGEVMAPRAPHIQDAPNPLGGSAGPSLSGSPLALGSPRRPGLPAGSIQSQSQPFTALAQQIPHPDTPRPLPQRDAAQFLFADPRQVSAQHTASSTQGHVGIFQFGWTHGSQQPAVQVIDLKWGEDVQLARVARTRPSARVVVHPTPFRLSYQPRCTPPAAANIDNAEGMALNNELMPKNSQLQYTPQNWSTASGVRSQHLVSFYRTAANVMLSVRLSSSPQTSCAICLMIWYTALPSIIAEMKAMKNATAYHRDDDQIDPC